MPDFNRQKHWENIYQTKQLNEVSWYQPTPETSLNIIEELDIPQSAAIIDIGGGDSFLADHLLKLGFRNVSVLDISETAIEKAKSRLGKQAEQVNWIVSDAVQFKPNEGYDLWHDRAAFHFLTEEKDIENYVETAQKGINRGGYLVIGTFSEQGPKKCSGIEIRQYSEASLEQRFVKFFEKVRCFVIDHKTPSDSVQNFVFCIFRRR